MRGYTRRTQNLLRLFELSWLRADRSQSGCRDQRHDAGAGGLDETIGDSAGSITGIIILRLA
jgi:hypothetical protein